MIKTGVARLLKKMPWSQDKDREKELQAQKSFIAELTKRAQLCLADPKFNEYLLMFKDFEIGTMNDMISLYEPDPVIYAFKMRELVNTLKAYRLLISSVQEDASRKAE